YADRDAGAAAKARAPHHAAVVPRLHLLERDLLPGGAVVGGQLEGGGHDLARWGALLAGDPQVDGDRAAGHGAVAAPERRRLVLDVEDGQHGVGFLAARGGGGE